MALQGAERLTRNIPSAWFAAGASKSAEPLHTFLQGLARHVDSERGSAASKELAQSLQQPLRKVGGEQTAQGLASAFKLQG